MIYILEHIIEKLSAAKYPCPVSVQDFYKVSNISTPLVAIQERPSNDGAYLDNQPVITKNTYQVEIYTKAKTIKNKAVSGIDLAKEIAKVVDDTLNQEFGFTMAGDISVQPYNDLTVTRLVLRYTAYIDKRINYIYRRV